jgi:predicted Fe-S protein YdhL (DUF1289 family)
MGAIDRLARQARQIAAGGCDEVPSPCVSICRMNPVSELCEGCFRTLDEIALWGRMEDKSKREVYQQIGRRIAVAQAQGEGKPA